MSHRVDEPEPVSHMTAGSSNGCFSHWFSRCGSLFAHRIGGIRWASSSAHGSSFRGTHRMLIYGTGTVVGARYFSHPVNQRAISRRSCKLWMNEWTAGTVRTTLVASPPKNWIQTLSTDAFCFCSKLFSDIVQSPDYCCIISSTGTTFLYGHIIIYSSTDCHQLPSSVNGRFRWLVRLSGTLCQQTFATLHRHLCF